MKFAVFGVNFGMPKKSRTKTREFPAAHPLAGGAVLVAVEGPSPGIGGREKREKKRFKVKHERKIVKGYETLVSRVR